MANWSAKAIFLVSPRCEQENAARNVARLREGSSIEIREEIARAHDGSGDQLREEADEERVIDGIADGLLLAAIDIHHVRDALEGVEADAQRQYDIEPERMRRFADRVARLAARKL